MSRPISFNNPAQFFNMLENLNFHNSGQTSSIRTYGDASMAPFTNLAQLESALRGGATFQHANQRYEAFRNLYDANSGFGALKHQGQEVLNHLFSRKSPEELEAFGKALKSQLMQAQMDPVGSAARLANELGWKGVSKSGSARGTALRRDFNFAAQGKWGHANIQNQLTLLDAAASGYAQAGTHGGNFFARAGGEASVDLVRLQTRGNVNLKGLGQLDFVGDARVGAHAQAHAGVQFGKDGVHAEIGASAFAGAEARASGTWKSNAGASANFSAAAVAGIGAEAGAKIGFKDGKLDFNLKLGLALGVGARFNVGFSLDFNKIGKRIKSFINNPIGSIKKTFSGFTKKLKGKLSSIAKNFTQKLQKKAREFVTKSVKKIGSKIKSGLKKAGKKVKKWFKKLF